MTVQPIAGYPAVIDVKSLDRWLCVPAFRQVCPYQQFHYLESTVTLQAHFYKMSKYRNRRRQLRVSDRRLLKYSMDISPDSALGQ